MRTNGTAAPRPPAIHISEGDYDIIADLALRMAARAPELSRMILDEMERAKVYPDSRLPENVVSIGSQVTFADERDGGPRTVQLVLPGEADIEAGRVSIMTPVGAGLIGMSVGGEISWPCLDGRSRALKILDVKQPSGRA
jgi:regulator of nucleoside diphosphate kinase